MVPQAASWHIDVRNAKLRVVRRLETTIGIDSIDW